MNCLYNIGNQMDLSQPKLLYLETNDRILSLRLTSNFRINFR